MALLSVMTTSLAFHLPHLNVLFNMPEQNRTHNTSPIHGTVNTVKAKIFHRPDEAMLETWQKFVLEKTKFCFWRTFKDVLQLLNATKHNEKLTFTYIHFLHEMIHLQNVLYIMNSFSLVIVIVNYKDEESFHIFCGSRMQPHSSFSK